jgi:hypothetical protein
MVFVASCKELYSNITGPVIFDSSAMLFSSENTETTDTAREPP